MHVDVVLIAYRFDPVPIFAAGNSDKIDINKWGGVIVDQDHVTSVHGVFAGGDFVRGPESCFSKSPRRARKQRLEAFVTGE